MINPVACPAWGLVFTGPATAARYAVVAGIAALTASASSQACNPQHVANLADVSFPSFDTFGYSVSVAGDTIIVGAEGLSFPDASITESAYIYRFDGMSVVEEARLLPEDGAAGDLFGRAVSISGDAAIVGASGNDDNGISSGSAYVFRHNGVDWVQEAKLLPTDGAAQDQFGSSVSISGTAAVIGAHTDDDNGMNSGSAYVFRYDGAQWLQESKLLPEGGAADDFFGLKVSISGDIAIVGAMRDDDNGNESGSAYVFRYDGSQWQQEAKLLPADGAAEDGFGSSVSVSGNVVVVGARGNDDKGEGTGSAYVFRFDGTQWGQEAKLLASDAAAGDFIGSSVGVSAETTGNGMPRVVASGGSGTSYIYRFDGRNWAEEARLPPPVGITDRLNSPLVAVSGNTAVIGLIRNITEPISAHVYDLNCPTDACAPDINGDGLLSSSDFVAWISAFHLGAPECDQNADGHCDAADFSAWIMNYNMGCP